MGRVLSMTERRVDGAAREEYLATLASRRATAAAAPAHFWVFEHASDRGRFVEFTEAASEDAIASVQGHDAPESLWREVQGG